MTDGLKWGVVLGVVTMFWHVLEKLTGFDGEFIEMHQTAGMMYLIPFILIYVLALLQKRNQNGGSLSLAEGMKHTLSVVLWALPFILAATYIKIKWLSPDFQSDMIEFLVTTGEEKEMLESAFSDLGVMKNTALYSLSGLLVGAISMIFIKR